MKNGRIRVRHPEGSGLIPRGPRLIATPLEALLLPGAVDQNPSHCLGGRREKMTAAAPVLVARFVLAHESKIGFVNQGRGLKRLARPLSRHLMRRQPAQFVINHCAIKAKPA